MTLQNYNVTNDAIGKLAVGIGASDTSITIGSGEGANFASSNQIVTVVQYETATDPFSNVVKKESMLLTNRSADSLTVVRAFQDSSATNFNSGDWIYASNHSAVTKDMQDELVRLESAKLNKGSLRTGLANAWRLFFSNGSSNETALSLGAAGTYLKSNGASSTPEWSNPPLDINGQTTSTSPTSSWYGVFYDGSNNVKVLLSNLYKALTSATTSQQGVVELSSDSEFTAGTSTGGTGAGLVATLAQIKKSISLKNSTTTTSDSNEFVVSIGGEDKRITQANLRNQIAASTAQKGMVELATDTDTKNGTSTTLVPTVNNLIVQPSESFLCESTTTVSTGSSSYVKLKEIRVFKKGTYRVKFNAYGDTGSGTAVARIYVNGIAVGLERTGIQGDSSNQYTFWENIAVNNGDYIQIYGKDAGDTCYITNFALHGSLVPMPTITLD